MEEGTVVSFPGQGDEGVDIQTGDVEVEIQIAPMAGWARGDDPSVLFYTVDLPLTDALCGCVVDVPTLDGRTLSVPVTQIVSPDYQKKVEGEGMVHPATGQKGALYVAFNIVFPKTLTPAQKSAV